MTARLLRFDWVALGLASFLLYLLTLCPTVYWYDSAEYAAAGALLGIPHPPGYPLYTLLAHVFTWLPGEPALNVNTMSAVFGAVACSLTCLVARRLGAGTAGGLLSGALLATTPLVWSNATVAEVYTAGLAFLLGTVLLLLHDRAVLAALLAGLGLGVHYSLATCGLGLLVLALRDDRSPRRIFACAGAALAGASILLALPLRAFSGPPSLMIGDPRTWSGFWWIVSGGTYKEWFTGGRDVLARVLQGGPGWIALLLAVAGLARLARRDLPAALALALAVAGNVAFFHAYRVHDVEVFLIPSIAIACVLTGVAFEGARENVRVAPALALAVLLWPAGRAAVLWRAMDRSGDRSAREFIARLDRELPRGALIFQFSNPSEWRFHAVFALYGQKVLGTRPDVVVPEWTLSPDQLTRAVASGRPVFAYVSHPELASLFRIREEAGIVRLLPRAE